jgi:hypothetical protein
MNRLVILAALMAVFSLPADARGPMDELRGAIVGSAVRRGTTVAAQEKDRPTSGSEASPRRWGVQLAGSFSKAKALASFVQVRARHPDLVGDRDLFVIDTPYGNRGPAAFYRVRLQVPSRIAAAELCERLNTMGGSCAVLSSR